jgi:hypothetical protein
MAFVIPRFKITTGGKFFSTDNFPQTAWKILSAVLVTGKITKEQTHS